MPFRRTVRQRRSRVARQPAKHGDCAGIEVALPRPPEPAPDDSEVVLGQPAAWIDLMQQGRAVVMSRYPLLIGVRDLVVDPDEGASLRPFDQPTGLPVEDADLVGVGPVDDGQGAVARAGVRARRSRRSSRSSPTPDHLAGPPAGGRVPD